MCRFDVCPCDSTFAEEWLALDNRLLLKYARTAYMNDRDDDDGSIRLWFEQQRQEFATFQKCFEHTVTEGTYNVSVRNEFD